MEKPTHWRFDDLEGQVFGRLTVIEFTGRKGKKLLWRCRCECGKESVVFATSLRSGTTRSCGCLHLEVVTRHGDNGSPEYFAWCALKNRCYWTGNIARKHYGGRGIEVCERWRDSYEAFLEDMGRRPSPDHSLDRIDVDGPYSPENCRWATREVQDNNRRNNRRLEHDGRTQTRTQWAREKGLSLSTLRYRLATGWSVGDAIDTPADAVPLLTHESRSLTAAEWSRITGIPSPTIRGRLQRGWSVADALLTPSGELIKDRNGGQ